jgi:hypothetical protein
MKHTFWMLLAVALLAGVVGCHTGPLGWGMFGSCRDNPTTCESCGQGDGDQACATNDCRSGGCRERGYDPTPSTGAVTYPYYTTRGPRDFLARNPRSIGP